MTGIKFAKVSMQSVNCRKPLGALFTLALLSTFTISGCSPLPDNPVPASHVDDLLISPAPVSSAPPAPVQVVDATVPEAPLANTGVESVEISGEEYCLIITGAWSVATDGGHLGLGSCINNPEDYGYEHGLTDPEKLYQDSLMMMQQCEEYGCP